MDLHQQMAVLAKMAVQVKMAVIVEIALLQLNKRQVNTVVQV